MVKKRDYVLEDCAKVCTIVMYIAAQTKCYSNKIKMVFYQTVSFTDNIDWLLAYTILYTIHISLDLYTVAC